VSYRSNRLRDPWQVAPEKEKYHGKR